MVQTFTPGYGRVRPGEQGIPGGIGSRCDAEAGQVTVFVEVDCLQETLARAEDNGGTVIAAPQALPQTDITVAYIADPEGHVIGLSQGLQRGNDILWSNWESHVHRE